MGQHLSIPVSSGPTLTIPQPGQQIARSRQTVLPLCTRLITQLHRPLTPAPTTALILLPHHFRLLRIALTPLTTTLSIQAQHPPTPGTATYGMTVTIRLPTGHGTNSWPLRRICVILQGRTVPIDIVVHMLEVFFFIVGPVGREWWRVRRQGRVVRRDERVQRVLTGYRPDEVGLVMVTVGALGVGEERRNVEALRSVINAGGSVQDVMRRLRSSGGRGEAGMQDEVRNFLEEVLRDEENEVPPDLLFEDQVGDTAVVE